MICTSDIVTCLKRNEIEPECSISGSVGLSRFPPSSGINYTLSQYYYVHAQTSEKRNWWQVDLKNLVYIKQYQLTASSWCNFVREWEFQISSNGSQWETVDKQGIGFSNNTLITLKNTVFTRYVRILGSAAGCGTPEIISNSGSASVSARSKRRLLELSDA